jgi:hypothetical protein
MGGIVSGGDVGARLDAHGFVGGGHLRLSRLQALHYH